MMKWKCKTLVLVLSMCSIVGGAVHAAEKTAAEKLADILQQSHRTDTYVERDPYRHPLEVLQFFDVQPQHTVVEIWPSRGWWAEILAPYLKPQGVYYAAGYAMTANRTPDYRRDIQKEFAEKLYANPEVYDHVVLTELSVPERVVMAPPGTVDRVLTFRNVHNWMKGEYADGMFAAMYKALKPGGQLGVVEHRARPGTSLEQMIESGYVTEAHVIALAEKAGFKLLEKSELNANPKDSADHPRGVWTLPPSLRHCKDMEEGAEQDKCFEHYGAIGESDRMTLKFLK